MNKVSKESIRELAEKYFSEALEIRQYLHQNPELSYQEVDTSGYIQKKLTEYKIPFKTGYVKTGVVARIEGKNPNKKTIVLRADMDALPITEKNTCDFKSAQAGIMHACGHDAHMASLLGTARILSGLREQFEGSVILIFQPAEEKIPGGARGMIEEGALAEFTPDVILAQHVMPELKAGTAGFKSGIYMASTDEIYLTVKGIGGHAALPHQLIDPVLIASHIIIALQQISSRFSPATIPTVLSFGKLEAKGASNIIPSEVEIAGTFRTMNEKWRGEAHLKIRQICESVATGMGGECIVNIQEGYPMVENNKGVTEKAMAYAKGYLGEEKVFELEPQLTAEDFAYFAQLAPATLFRLGTDNPAGDYSFPLHSPYFGIDEGALKTGMGLMAWLTISLLYET